MGATTILAIFIKKKRGTQAPNKGVLMPDGSVFTGYYPNWSELSKEDKQRRLDSRSKKKKGGLGNKRQISDVTSIAEQLQVIKRTISELVLSKNDHINSVSSEDKEKSKIQHAQNDAGNAFGGRCARSNQERQLPLGLTILSYMFSLAAYWSPLRHRIISGIVSSVRKIAKTKTTKTEYQHRPQPTSYGRIELDTHADTTVLGSNCVVLSYTGKECEVSPYSSQYEAVRDIPVVTGATVWTNVMDGTAYLLIFHESLWMGNKLDHTLVSPNQFWAYGVNVQDNPFDAKPLSITTDDASVELYSEGTIICGDTRTPTESKLSQLPRLILTSPHDWDPHNVCFPSCNGQPSNSASIESNHSILAVDTLLQHTIYDPIMVASLMLSHVQAAEMTMPSTIQDIPSSICQ